MREFRLGTHVRMGPDALTALVLNGAGPGAGVGPGGVALAGGAASAATRRQRSTRRL